MKLTYMAHRRRRREAMLLIIWISNRYLQENGFNIGDIIEVEYQPKTLIIRRVRDNPNDGVRPPIPTL